MSMRRTGELDVEREICLYTDIAEDISEGVSMQD